MTDIILWKNIPPEIWNHIAFFTKHNEVSLIQFLVFYLKLGKFRLDIPKLEKIYYRNLKHTGCFIIQNIQDSMYSGTIFIPYEALYPSSMITENIPHENFIQDEE